MSYNLHILLSLILIAVAQCKPATLPAAQEPFTLEEVLYGGYGARGYSLTWVSETEYLFRDSSTGDVMIRDINAGQITTLVPDEVLAEYTTSSYSLSDDRKYLLLSYDYQSGFRHSGKAKYVVYDIEVHEYIHIANESYLQVAQWTPDGSRLVFVKDNNIYYQHEPRSQTIALSFNGVPGVVYNGAPDWVYEEEILASGSAFWVASNSLKVAFIEFVDNDVPEFTYSLYGNPGTLEDQYPQQITIKYPKSGQTNPKVKLLVADMENNGAVIHTLETPVEQVSDDHILYTVTWADKENLAATWTNRVQNKSVTILYNLPQNTFQQIHEASESNGWVIPYTPEFNFGTETFLTVEFREQSDGDRFQHIALYKYDGTSTSVTQGKFSVLSILHWSSPTIYFLATAENQPTQRHVYSISEDGSNQQCISCDVKTPEGNACSYASASFSVGGRYHTLTCSGPDPAVVYLHKTNAGPDGEPLESNENLRQRLQNKQQAQIYDTEVEVAGGFKAKVRLLLPPGLDQTGTTKYPLLVNVYAGPDSTQITDGFGIGFQQFMTTNLSIIYGYIDGRGSGLKGSNMLFSGYRNLGSVEIEDQINVTRQLQKDLPWIDASRTGIWGWSYGGYATVKTLEKDLDGVFKCGISVAPVTNWIYYDSMYTERFMGVPEGDNELGYQQSSALEDVSNLKNKQYFLIHGSGDDNVHYQQSMLLTKVLETEDIMFRQQSYTDENHSIPSYQYHLYHTMTKFWENCLKN